MARSTGPEAIWYGTVSHNFEITSDGKSARDAAWPRERGEGHGSAKGASLAVSLPSCTWSSRRSSNPGSCGCAPFVRTCRMTSDRAPC